MSAQLFLDPTQAINTYKTNISALVPNWLLCRKEVSDGAKLLYARLQQYQGESGEITPLLATLSKELAKSERQIQNLIAELRDGGLIRVQDRRSAGESNVYELLAHPWWQEAFLGYLTVRPELARVRPDLAKSASSGSRNGLRGPHEADCVTLRESSEENQGRESFLQPVAPLPAEEIEAAPAPPSPASRPPAASSPAPPSNPECNEGKQNSPDPRCIPPVGSDTTPVSAAHLRDSNAAAEVAIADLERRKKSATYIASEAKQKANEQRAKNLARRPRVQHAPVDEYVPPEDLQKSPKTALQKIWQGEMATVFPDNPQSSVWGGREWSQLKMLLERYDADRVEETFRYVIRNWIKLRERFFKGKGSPVPNIGVTLSLHASLFPEAAVWAKHRAVIEEYNSYGDKYASRPDELSERYLDAQKELHALGLD